MAGPPQVAVDSSVLAVVGALAVVAITALIYMIMNKSKTNPAPAARVAAGGAVEETTKKGKKKKAKLGMARLRQMERDAEHNEDDGGAADDDIDFQAMDRQDDDDAEHARPVEKIGAKKAAKLAAKAEKAENRKAMEMQREDAKQREALRREEADAARAEEDAEEKLKEEEERLRVEEEKRKEEEEYQAMKAMFSVEEAGSVADEIADESQSLLSELITYVKETKIVMIEELAAKFKIKSIDAKMRLEALEKMGQITGVMDDRGKYIYISDDEFKKVVKFIRQRGRLSIAELAENSHKLISLTGSKEVAS
jgi:hypothetical protein